LQTGFSYQDPGFPPLRSGLESDSKKLESEHLCQPKVSMDRIRIGYPAGYLWFFWIRNGFGYLFLKKMDQDRIDRIRIFVWFLKRNFPESDSRCHKWWWRCSLCYDYYKQKIQMILSVCAALMTINDNSCYFIANIFRRGGSSKLLLYCWYAASFCYAEWLAYVCVVLVNIVYFMGGQLVSDLDRLEIFLITRDW